jgi:hypothetical protein
MNIAVESMINLIEEKFSRDEKQYIASMLQLSLLKLGDNSTKLKVFENSMQPKTEISLPTNAGELSFSGPENKSDAQITVADESHQAIFKSKKGIDITYGFVKKAILKAKPKNIQKIKNSIAAQFKAIGDVDQKIVDKIYNQMLKENLFVVIDEVDIIWNK